MKKLALLLCVIAICAAVFSLVERRDAAKADGTPVVSVSEAAFSLRAGETQDATSTLVGAFGKEGTADKLFFDGAGGVTWSGMNLVGYQGSYRLTQASDGAAILQLHFSEETTLYSFRLISPEGDFTLVDADGVISSYKPEG